MLIGSKASITKCNIFTSNTLIDCFVLLDFLKHASITIVVIANANLFIINTLNQLILLLPDLLNNLFSLLIPTERTLNHTIILELILHPLTKAIQMKGIPTNIGAGGNRIRLNNLHVADGTKIFQIILILLGNYEGDGFGFAGDLQEVTDTVGMDPTIGDYVPQLFVVVGGKGEEGAVQGDEEDLG